MASKYISLRQCLFSAFASEDSYDPQDRQQMWAISEGLRRVERYQHGWHYKTSQKEHECVRGHRIPTRTVYILHRQPGSSYGAGTKICAGCMAMIMYFWRVDALDPYLYTHWDKELEKPVDKERQ